LLPCAGELLGLALAVEVAFVLNVDLVDQRLKFSALSAFVALLIATLVDFG
jgi:hypothetical protein